MKSTLNVKLYSSIRDLSKNEWEQGNTLSKGMRFDYLKAIETSSLNNLTHYYLQFYDDQTLIGLANLYVTDTDLSTLDGKLQKIRPVIKGWYPDFLTFKVLECGFFTILGEGFQVFKPDAYKQVLPTLIEQMDVLAREHRVDIQFIRDIYYDTYPLYKDLLKQAGFYPTLGFPDTVMDIRWNNKAEYLADLKTGTRNKIKKGFKEKKARNITHEFTYDYYNDIPVLEKLWLNVYQKNNYYKREFFDRRFFTTMYEQFKDHGEMLLFRQKGAVIAFMYSVYNEESYVPIIWGVDYTIKDYRTLNIYRTATVLCLERAIHLGKNKIEFEITNYTPKMFIGGEIKPIIYFIKHTTDIKYSKALAKQIADNIELPDNTKHHPFKNTNPNPVDIYALEKQIKKDRFDTDNDDIFRKVDKYHTINLSRLSGIYNMYPEFKSAQTSSITLDSDRQLILLGTNSYLGAAIHPEVMKAASDAIYHYGTGCSGSPLLNGTLDIHKLLEQELTQFMQKEAVMVCSTGYQTNLTALSALCKPGDSIIMDERSHRSLFDGARLSGANIFVYKHNNMHHLEKRLRSLSGKRKLIVSDSVFSMEGRLADLPGICRLGEAYKARIYIDEAHGIGVLGKNGRGACELLGVEQDVDLIMCTFSKSFASIGGFIAGDAAVIDYLKHNGGGHIYSAGLPPSAIATVRAVLHIIQNQPELRKDILEKSHYMGDALRDMGYNAHFLGTQIIHIILGNEVLALTAYKKFMEEGVYVNPVVPSAVPAKESGFRTSYIASHTWEDLNKALDVFNKYKNELTILTKENEEVI